MNSDQTQAMFKQMGVKTLCMGACKYDRKRATVFSKDLRTFFTMSLSIPRPSQWWRHQGISAKGRSSRAGLPEMELNAGYIGLGISLVVFLGLQIWWLGMTIKNGRNQTEPFELRSQPKLKQTEEIKKQLEKIFSKSPWRAFGRIVMGQVCAILRTSHLMSC